jgi:hypothetical protein
LLVLETGVILMIALYEDATDGQSKNWRTSCRSGVGWWMLMSFIHPSCAAIVIVTSHRSSKREKRPILFSIAVAMSVELLLIMISMTQGTFVCY